MRARHNMQDCSPEFRSGALPQMMARHQNTFATGHDKHKLNTVVSTRRRISGVGNRVAARAPRLAVCMSLCVDAPTHACVLPLPCSCTPLPPCSTCERAARHAWCSYLWISTLLEGSRSRTGSKEHSGKRSTQCRQPTPASSSSLPLTLTSPQGNSLLSDECLTSTLRARPPLAQVFVCIKCDIGTSDMRHATYMGSNFRNATQRVST
jgi:hypothetical protein